MRARTVQVCRTVRVVADRRPRWIELQLRGVPFWPSSGADTGARNSRGFTSSETTSNPNDDHTDAARKSCRYRCASLVDAKISCAQRWWGEFLSVRVDSLRDDTHEGGEGAQQGQQWNVERRRKSFHAERGIPVAGVWATREWRASDLSLCGWHAGGLRVVARCQEHHLVKRGWETRKRENERTRMRNPARDARMESGESYSTA